MRYDDVFDAFEPEDDGRTSARSSSDGFDEAPWDEPSPHRLSRRELRRKRRLEKQLRRLEMKEGKRRDEQDPGRQAEEQEMRMRRRSSLTRGLVALMTGSVLSRKGVTKTYPYLVFVAFLAFMYIGNIFSMQRLHRQHAVLAREVKELRIKSMTIASECMQATRQSNIIKEIDRRGIPLKESLEPNQVIPK